MRLCQGDWRMRCAYAPYDTAGQGQ